MLVRLIPPALALALAACAATPLDRFPSTPEERIQGSRTELRVPEGARPRPAVVLLHTCGGIGPHLRMWATRLALEGYVVLMVDSFGPRGEWSVCDKWTVTVDQVAADAAAGANHLRQLPFVDRDRIFIVGFSYGAMAGLRLASASYLKRLGAAPFRGVAGFYPFCTPNPMAPPRYASINDNLYGDIATPVHLFLGGADNEAPPGFCTGPADARKAAGQPIGYTVFAGATHGFDQSDVARGYRYDPDAVESAWNRLREFLGR